MVPRAGLEPARLSTEDFESTKSTISSPRHCMKAILGNDLLYVNLFQKF
jgi:hypothetical protein